VYIAALTSSSARSLRRRTVGLISSVGAARSTTRRPAPRRHIRVQRVNRGRRFSASRTSRRRSCTRSPRRRLQRPIFNAGLLRLAGRPRMSSGRNAHDRLGNRAQSHLVVIQLQCDAAWLGPAPVAPALRGPVPWITHLGLTPTYFWRCSARLFNRNARPDPHRRCSVAQRWDHASPARCGRPLRAPGSSTTAMRRVVTRCGRHGRAHPRWREHVSKVKSAVNRDTRTPAKDEIRRVNPAEYTTFVLGSRENFTRMTPVVGSAAGADQVHVRVGQNLLRSPGPRGSSPPSVMLHEGARSGDARGTAVAVFLRTPRRAQHARRSVLRQSWRVAFLQYSIRRTNHRYRETTLKHLYASRTHSHLRPHCQRRTRRRHRDSGTFEVKVAADRQASAGPIGRLLLSSNFTAGSRRSNGQMRAQDENLGRICRAQHRTLDGKKVPSCCNTTAPSQSSYVMDVTVVPVRNRELAESPES
jgi:hypothetical protein